MILKTCNSNKCVRAFRDYNYNGQATEVKSICILILILTLAVLNTKLKWGLNCMHLVCVFSVAYFSTFYVGVLTHTEFSYTFLKLRYMYM